ncbi:MAG: type I-C CRISPR-associated protein Cas5c [Paludibacteraceae bacterium]|nr:type I-C CRISPR-associated protein Cas5c [Paludibacteraceae bacterium]
MKHTDTYENIYKKFLKEKYEGTQYESCFKSERTGDYQISKTYCMEVSGPMALFNRPEAGGDKNSYDVITPSAIKGIFEHSFWKPAIMWEPVKVEVLNKIQFTNFTSRLQNNKISIRNVQKCQPVDMSILDNISMCNHRVLVDVKYRIYARMTYIPVEFRQNQAQTDRSPQTENPKKYFDIIECCKRLANPYYGEKGYFGQREYTARTRYIPHHDLFPEQLLFPAIKYNRDLGWMFYGMDFAQSPYKRAFFKAQLVDGVMHIPRWGEEGLLIEP